MVKKQEAEAATTSEEEETMEQCIARHRENDPELTEEAARAACEEERKKPPPPAETAAEEKGLLSKMEKVIDEVTEFKFKQKFGQLEERLNKRTDEIEDRYVRALKKSLGVPDEDTAVTHAELPEAIRKVILAMKPEGKKTMTKTSEKPDEGK
jgi:hypothetical protein